MDGGDLYDRRARNAGPGAGAAVLPIAIPRLLSGCCRCIADHSAEYLIRQIEAGADAVQIFDSWAGVLDEASFEAHCVEPVARIVERVRAAYPDVPIIGFPRAPASLYADYRAARPA